MRPRRLVLLVLAIAILGAGLYAVLLTWVPKDSELAAWEPESGRLTVFSRGFAFAPRWSRQRLAWRGAVAEIDAPTGDGAGTTVTLRWRPGPGTYPLGAAENPPSGLRAAVGPAVREVVAAIPLRCLVGPRAEDCPGDLGGQVAARAAATIGGGGRDFEATISPDPEAVRQWVLGSIAAGLPAAQRKVLVFGLDGLDWDLVLPWIRGGEMPNFARLMAAGTWGEMKTLVPTLSPLIWTTMATGVSPDRHGILDFVEKDPKRGTMVPVTSRSRRVPALWNLASALDRSVSVVGWWGTWPAERIDGVMVSDRLYYTLTQGLTKAVLREDLPDVVFPDDREKEIVELRDRAVRETDWPAVRYFMPISEERFQTAVDADQGMDDPVDGFRRILASTRTYLGSGLQLAASEPDLMMIYLEGTDTIGHLLAPYMPPPTVEVDPALAAAYVAAVPKYFAVVDHWLGRYLEAYPLSEYTYVLVSDHGFKWQKGRPRGLSGTAGPTAPLWHAPDAIFLLAGPGVERRGRIAEAASVYDVAPTVLALLGLPADRSWQGSVLPGCPPPALAPIDWQPLVPAESYRQTGGGAEPVDPEYIAKLKSLGYLGSGGETAAEAAVRPPPELPAPAPPPPDVPEDATVTRGELNNLAVLKIGEKKYDEAERILRQVIQMSPAYPSPHYNLRRIYMETERYDDADRELWIAVDKGLRDPQRSIDQAAKDYDDLDLQPRSVTLLSEGIRRFPEHEPFYVHALVDRIRLSQCAEGLELGSRAAEKFPDSAPVHAFWGLAAGCAGDLDVARAAITRSLALNPDQPSLKQALSQLSAGG